MIRGQLDDRKRASKTDMESNWRAFRDARAEEGCECADERPRGASEEGNFFCEVTKEFVHSRSIVAAQGSDDFILGRIHKWNQEQNPRAGNNALIKSARLGSRERTTTYASKIQETADGRRCCARSETRRKIEVVAQRRFQTNGRVDEREAT